PIRRDRPARTISPSRPRPIPATFFSGRRGPEDNRMEPEDPEPHPPDARAAFERFTCRLVALARGHLDGRLRTRVDPEDVVQSVYKSFLLRYGVEKLAGKDEDELWALLTRITLRKCADRARYYRAERRDSARATA